MITTSCITCRKNCFENFCKKKDAKNGKLITVVICQNCGTIQVQPRPDEKETLAYYSDETYRAEKVVDDAAVFEKLVKRGELIQKNIKSLGLPSEKILEIGCGVGSILKPFIDSGSSVVGYELNREEVKYGSSKGLNLRYGTIDDVKEDECFDVIIYSHVIEHLVYPLKELAKVRKHLKEGGALVVLLPGFNNMQVHKYKLSNYIVFPHLQYFTLTSLTNLLGEAGFKRVYGVEEIHSIFVRSEERRSINSDYSHSKKALQLYKIYAFFYTPIFRVKRKIKKILNLG